MSGCADHETQLMRFEEDRARNMTSGKQTDLILLDFSNAFDKVNHLKLLYKLQKHGVQRKILGWIESFLMGRSQTVVLNGNSSDELQVFQGSPRGQSWVPSYSCSMTYQTACSPKFVLQMILQCT